MSIELRRNPETQELQCDWGTFENPEGDVKRGLHQLLLIQPETVNRMLANGPEPNFRGPGTVRCTQDGDHCFVHLDLDSKTQITWELFEAHWWDGLDCPILVGKWPNS